MREMRELQAEVANATYKTSSLGRLPAEVFNVILSFLAQPDQRPVGTSWPTIRPSQASFSGLIRTCRRLCEIVKAYVLARAVLYFRTPDAILSFLESQKLSPTVAQRDWYLDTVILDVRKNANWPLRTEIRAINTPLPTTEEGWEARIKAEASKYKCVRGARRHLARSNATTMVRDWADGVASLLNEFAIKTLIVRGDKGFRTGLISGSRLIETLISYGGSIENVIEVGERPQRGKGALLRMVCADPGKAQPQQPSF